MMEVTNETPNLSLAVTEDMLQGRTFMCGDLMLTEYLRGKKTSWQGI